MICILTTVRNGMPHIKEQFASVQRQTYKNFQHVIVDDGSSDETVNFLQHQSGHNLSLIQSSPVGRGRALNLGLAEINSEFLAILDADDVASPCWLAVMLKIMQENPQISVLTCRGVLDVNRVEVDPAGKTTAYLLDPHKFLYGNPVHHSGTLIRRRDLLEVGRYDESRRSLFDYELWVRFLIEKKQIWRVDNGFIYKRIHSAQHFERRKRLSYLMGTYQIRRQLTQIVPGVFATLVPLLIFIYGFLPRRFRHGVVNAIKFNKRLS